MIRRRPLLLALPALTLAAPALAQAPPPLSERDRANVARAEAYLDSIRTLTARFLQIDARGRTAEGRLWLQRPGRMRFEYDPPSPILLVADGTFVIFHDKSVRQTSNIPLAATPLSVLLADRIRLSGGDVVPTRVGAADGLLQVTVVKRASPSDGSITLVFADTPLELKQWRIVDSQAQEVRVSLFSPTTGGRFDPALFRFVDPNFFENTPR